MTLQKGSTEILEQQSDCPSVCFWLNGFPADYPLNYADQQEHGKRIHLILAPSPTIGLSSAPSDLLKKWSTGWEEDSETPQLKKSVKITELYDIQIDAPLAPGVLEPIVLLENFEHKDQVEREFEDLLSQGAADAKLSKRQKCLAPLYERLAPVACHWGTLPESLHLELSWVLNFPVPTGPGKRLVVHFPFDLKKDDESAEIMLRWLPLTPTVDTAGFGDQEQEEAGALIRDVTSSAMHGPMAPLSKNIDELQAAVSKHCGASDGEGYSWGIALRRNDTFPKSYREYRVLAAATQFLFALLLSPTTRDQREPIGMALDVIDRLPEASRNLDIEIAAHGGQAQAGITISADSIMAYSSHEGEADDFNLFEMPFGERPRFEGQVNVLIQDLTTLSAAFNAVHINEESEGRQ